MKLFRRSCLILAALTLGACERANKLPRVTRQPERRLPQATRQASPPPRRPGIRRRSRVVDRDGSADSSLRTDSRQCKYVRRARSNSASGVSHAVRAKRNGAKRRAARGDGRQRLRHGRAQRGTATAPMECRVHWRSRWRPSRSDSIESLSHNDSLTFTIGATPIGLGASKRQRRTIHRTSVRRARRVAVQHSAGPAGDRRDTRASDQPGGEHRFRSERSSLPSVRRLTARCRPYTQSGRTATKKRSKAAKCSPRFCSAAHETLRSFSRTTLETPPRTRSSSAATMDGGARDGRARGVTASCLSSRRRCDPTRPVRALGRPRPPGRPASARRAARE